VPFEDLKKTINLPKTAFAMKANLPQNEPKMLERWEQMGIYERIRAAERERRATSCTTAPLTPAVPSTWAPR
jgi:Isoleucyl-tRNA synthetase